MTPVSRKDDSEADRLEFFERREYWAYNIHSLVTFLGVAAVAVCGGVSLEYGLPFFQTHLGAWGVPLFILIFLCLIIGATCGVVSLTFPLWRRATQERISAQTRLKRLK